MHNPPARQIKRVDRFNEQVDALKGDFQRLDSVLEGISPVVCERPEAFNIVIGKDGWHYFKIASFPNVPALTIFFRFDEEFVYLLWAEPCEEIEK